MSDLRRRIVSALVAAMSIGGFSREISNFACASSVGDPSACLDGLINGVRSMGGYDRGRVITRSVNGDLIYIPCLGGKNFEFRWNEVQLVESAYGQSLERILNDYFPALMPSNDSSPAPISRAPGPLKKSDGRLMYGAQGNNFMPWLSKDYLSKFTDVSSVALWVLEKSKGVDKMDKRKGVKSLKAFVGNKIFKDCKKRWDSDYDFEAVCAALYDLVKEFNEYCDKLKAVISGLPVDTSKVNVSVLEQSEDRAGVFSKIFEKEDIRYDCVVRLAEAILNLFTV